MAGRARRYEARFRAQRGLKVQGGPFAGMRYPTDLRGVDAAAVKLSGEYEAEIVPAIETLLAKGRFIDLGCADGYFAVGAALRGCEVDAFDLARSARRHTDRLARLNGVSVRLHGKADPGQLRDLAGPDVGVLCDIEGAEADLFDPATCRALKRSPVVIELHETARPGVTDQLVAAFERPHTIVEAVGREEERRSNPTRWLVLP